MESTPKYKISIIIVNYNVEYFLEQCLNSVKSALKGINGQVFIVDNNSIDGSVEMVQRKFPEYDLIANKDNKGFSKANNQAILLSDAEYILLLNPDTVVEEDTFSKVINFMDSHPEAGGLGVRMIDGKGKFLPESKRGLPTPAVAFYKIFGLSRLFPRSKKFGQYHLGHLDEFKTNEIEILSGAFMLMRKKALDKVGLLDEAFFMYGEDIDLSYRIIKGGYKNYYFPETQIIHYKGESTKKSSVNYVFVFYRAMVIFAKKHFSQKNAKLFSFLINAAIYFRAALAIISRFIKRSITPLVDISIVILGLFALTHQWTMMQIEFPDYVINVAIPVYTFIWMISILFNGGYDFPVRFRRIFRGILIGTLAILIVYALLPKNFQFSRLFILIGALWIAIYFLISRVFLHFAIGGKYKLTQTKTKSFAIVGSQQEFERVSGILTQTHLNGAKLFRVSTSDTKEENTIGNIHQLDQIAHIYSIDEIIFSAKDSSAQSIIYWMSKIDKAEIDYKIAQPDSISLIGSNSIDKAGELYVMNVNSILTPENVRKKRTFDFLVALILLILSPVLVFLFTNKRKFFRNIFNVLMSKKSIVGYHISNSEETFDLPKIKRGILTPSDSNPFFDESMSDKLNLIYARDYSIKTDMSILLKSWKKLDR